MILDSLLIGMILFSSFAMRTPNVQPNPDDYELNEIFFKDLKVKKPDYFLALTIILSF